MATPVDIGPEGSELGALVATYLQAAEAGRTLDRAGRRYSPAGVRSLRRALAQVEAAAGPLDAAALKVMDAASVERLARQVVEHAGLPPSRLGTILDALRGLSAYAGARRGPAAPPPRADAAPWPDPAPWSDPAPWPDPAPAPDPAPWPDPPPWVDPPPPPRATPGPPPQSHSQAAPEARMPTFTMLALGSHLSAWIERIIVIAFVLTVIGLALELV